MVNGDTSEFWTVEETATRLRVSKMTIYRMIHRREIDAIRVGRSFRVRTVSLEKLLA